MSNFPRNVLLFLIHPGEVKAPLVITRRRFLARVSLEGGRLPKHRVVRAFVNIVSQGVSHSAICRSLRMFRQRASKTIITLHESVGRSNRERMCASLLARRSFLDEARSPARDLIGAPRTKQTPSRSPCSFVQRKRFERIGFCVPTAR